MSRRLVVHVVVAVLSWLLFAYYWWLVSRRQLNPQTLQALTILTALVAALWVATVAWVGHNLRLARRLGERRQRRASIPELRPVDTLGRTVEREGAVPPALAPYLEIDIDEERGIKRMRSLGHAPQAEEVGV